MEKGEMLAKIVKLFRGPGEDPNPLCVKCPDDLHDMPYLGLRILWGMTRDGDEWSGGRILDPDNGSAYKCHIAVVDGGTRLKVRGYIGFSLLGRTQYWERIEKPE
jgi:uncharacterized protein (DUF2147 family)